MGLAYNSTKQQQQTTATKRQKQNKALMQWYKNSLTSSEIDDPVLQMCPDMIVS
jgi:hypothetical protein